MELIQKLKCTICNKVMTSGCSPQDFMVSVNYMMSLDVVDIDDVRK